jgi:sec-independent protein translocase protein TatA
MILGFTLGPAEIAVIVLIVLLIFGPSKLPQLGKSVGQMLRGFKKEMKSIHEDDEEASASASADAALPRPKPSEIDVTPTATAEKKTTSSAG